MPTTCGFPNCKFRSRYRGFEDNRHFYRVPKKPAVLRDKWLEAIGRTEANIVSQLRICSGHFHGGEKREGDIPVRDPATDPPRRIELPPKAARLASSSLLEAGTRRGGSSYGALHGRHGPRGPCRRGGLSSYYRGGSHQTTRPPATPHLLPSFCGMTSNNATLESTWSCVFQVWNSLMVAPNARIYLPHFPLLPGLALPTPTAAMQAYSRVCVSKKMAIFGEPPCETVRNHRPPIEDSIIIRKLSDAYQKLKTFQSISVAVFYDVGLVNKEILRQFMQLQYVVLADIYSGATDELSLHFKEKGLLVKALEVDYDVNAAADAVFRKILSCNYGRGRPATTSESHQKQDCAFSRPLRSRTLGIYGLDAIGLAVARRCVAFGVQAIVYDQSLPDGLATGLGLKRTERLHDLLFCCDFLTFHNPYAKGPTPPTDFQLTITNSHLDLLKPGVSIVCLANNVAFDVAGLSRVLGQGTVKHIVLTTDNIRRVLPGCAGFPAFSTRLPGMIIINKSELITKESLFLHQKRVENVAANLLRNDTANYIPMRSDTDPAYLLKTDPVSVNCRGKTEEDSTKPSERAPFTVDALVTTQTPPPPPPQSHHKFGSLTS